jgi:tetratricopeptide (TPR) repeat protein
MSAPRLTWLPVLLVAVLGCAALNYPEPKPAADATAERPAGLDHPPGPTSSNLDSLDSQSSETAGLPWNELTRMARNHAQRGEFVLAEERLDQAAAQLADLPPYSASRRAVFGMQARLAIQLAAQGETARADLLANRLFEIAEAEPEIGGDALIALARSVVARRSEAAARGEAGFPDEERLRILDIAFTTAAAGPIHRDRLQLSFEIAQQARRLGDLDLANRAIKQAEQDSRTLHPGATVRAATIAVHRARIALARGELEEAAAAATRANRLFEEASADDALRGIAEITLAQVLARQGEIEKAFLVARTAQSRLDAEPPVSDHVRRTILGGLARVEARAGDLEEARRTYQAALEVPSVDAEADQDLVRDLALELRALDSAPPVGTAPIGDQPPSSGDE